MTMIIAKAGEQTSAIGSMVRSNALGMALVGAGFLYQTTMSSYPTFITVERTAAGPSGQLDVVHKMPVQAETSAEAVFEIRRRSGLTWEEIADLFDVSRRSVHHWASGKAVNAEHDRRIRRVLTVVRRLDSGEAKRNRDLLLSPSADGRSLYDLLKAAAFTEATARTGAAPSSAKPRTELTKLSKDAQLARQPESPVTLLGALQDRPDVPSRARVARTVRVPKAVG